MDFESIYPGFESGYHIFFFCHYYYSANSTLLSLLRLSYFKGWSGGAMVLGKLPVPGRPTIWITVGQGPTALA